MEDGSNVNSVRPRSRSMYRDELDTVLSGMFSLFLNPSTGIGINISMDEETPEKMRMDEETPEKMRMDEETPEQKMRMDEETPEQKMRMDEETPEQKMRMDEETPEQKMRMDEETPKRKKEKRKKSECDEEGEEVEEQRNKRVYDPEKDNLGPHEIRRDPDGNPLFLPATPIGKKSSNDE